MCVLEDKVSSEEPKHNVKPLVWVAEEKEKNAPLVVGSKAPSFMCTHT